MTKEKETVNTAEYSYSKGGYYLKEHPKYVWKEGDTNKPIISVNQKSFDDFKAAKTYFIDKKTTISRELIRKNFPNKRKVLNPLKADILISESHNNILGLIESVQSYFLKGRIILYNSYYLHTFLSRSAKEITGHEYGTIEYNDTLSASFKKIITSNYDLSGKNTFDYVPVEEIASNIAPTFEDCTVENFCRLLKLAMSEDESSQELAFESIIKCDPEKWWTMQLIALTYILKHRSNNNLTMRVKFRTFLQKAVKYYNMFNALTNWATCKQRADYPINSIDHLLSTAFETKSEELINNTVNTFNESKLLENIFSFNIKSIKLNPEIIVPKQEKEENGNAAEATSFLI